MDTPSIQDIGVQFFLDHFENPRIMRDVCTEQIVVHFSWGVDKDREETIAMLERAGAPQVEVDDAFSAGDRVALRLHSLFPHPSGTTVRRNENVIMRFEGSKIAEIWVAMDRLHEREQREHLPKL